MQNDLKYTVRSREIVDLVTAMRGSRLTLSPYFQRNLVWRDRHKRDFIETILKGFPFPQIFLSRGPIDLDTMEASQAVVDGQQRLNAIRDFVDGKLDIDGKYFKELSARAREDFLKYEVPVIDFDLDAGDPRLKDIFHRLNRTYYSLSAIEKLASEYSASEFMLVARVLSGEITKQPEDDDILEDTVESPPLNSFHRDPFIDDETWDWLLARADREFATLVQSKPIFSKLEFDRKVPLMFTLNLMCTFLSGYYNRNDKVRKLLDDRSERFPERDEVIDALNRTAMYIGALALPDTAIWWNKANFFSLVCELSRSPHLQRAAPDRASERLSVFAANVPADYALAAREGVGRKAQRELRGRLINELLSPLAP